MKRTSVNPLVENGMAMRKCKSLHCNDLDFSENDAANFLYCPNIDWDAIRVEAVFEGKVESCDTDVCLVRQDDPLPFPEYLFSEIEQYVIKELTMSIQVPTDGADDSQNTLR